MNGGGGSNGQTVYDWNPTMAAYWQGTEQNPGGYLGVANNQFWKDYGQGFQKYDANKRVAGLSGDEEDALAGFRDMAYRPESMPDVWAGRQQNTDTAQGKYLGQNAWASATNKYEGLENPYFKGTVSAGLRDMGDAYEKGTAADTRADMALGGLLGSSAHRNAVSSNQDALAKRMGDFTNQMYSGQYDRSAGMDEARLGRASGAYESERGRMLQGANQGLAGQALSSDLYNNLMRGGQLSRGIDQQRADFNYGQFQDEQNYGRNMLDWMGNYLSRAQGGIGGQVNMYGGSGGSSLGQGLGAALMGYGMFRG